MIIQMFNLFACKARIRLPFGKQMLINKYTWVSIIAGAGFASIIVYAPPFNIAFGTSTHLSPLYWLISFAFGFVVIGYATLRTMFLRVFKPLQWNPEISGLQMYPTRWSTGH